MTIYIFAFTLFMCLAGLAAYFMYRKGIRREYSCNVKGEG